jgi:hypothetical protein
MELNDYLKERNIPLDSLEANSIVEGFQLAEKVFGGIPKAFKVGGQPIDVKFVERCDNNWLGCCRVAKGCIEIADKYDRDEKVSEGGKLNTFYHELTHAILYTMGETDLNNNEKFVCTFSSLLTEALTTAKWTQ